MAGTRSTSSVSNQVPAPAQQKKSKRRPFVWNLSSLNSMINNFRKQHQAGGEPEFEAFWEGVRYPSTKNYTTEECCRRFCELKKEWKMVEDVLGCEGFTWLRREEMIDGSEESWTILEEVDMDLASLKGKHLPLYQTMKEYKGVSEEYSCLPEDVAYPSTLAVEKQRLTAQKQEDTRRAAIRAEALSVEGRQRREQTRLEVLRAAGALTEAEYFQKELDRFKARELAEAQKAAREAALSLGRKRRNTDNNNDDLSKRARTNVQSVINLLTSVQLTSEAEEVAITEALRLLATEDTLTDLGKANFTGILSDVKGSATAYINLRHPEANCNTVTKAWIIKGHFEDWVEHSGSLTGGESAQRMKANFVAPEGV